MLAKTKRFVAAVGLKPAARALMSFTIRGMAAIKRYRTSTRNGIKYRLDLHELIDSSIFMTGEWESETCRFLRHTLAVGDTVIEAGANIGAHTLVMAKQTYPGLVFAFEPTNAASKKLRANRDLNPDLTNVQIIQSVLSDGQHSLPKTAFRHSWNTRSAGISAAIEEITADCTSVDEFVSSRNIESLALLKIDVDGYDLRVLRGARSTLRRLRPTVLVEIDEESLMRVGDSPQGIFSFMESCGYRVTDTLGYNCVFSPSL